MSTACPITSHIPWPADQMWSSFAQQCLYFPPSLILFLAGLRTYLNHKGSLIMLSHKGMLLGGGVLSFESGFPFHYPPFLSLCQPSGEGFKEFPEGTFGKWLILFAEILNVYKTSICNLVVMSLSIHFHCVKILFLFLSPSPFPMGFLF